MNSDLLKIYSLIFLFYVGSIVCLFIILFAYKREENIEYKNKNYRILKTKQEQKVRPIGEKYNKSAEITVKDYEAGKWNVTINVNGETITVGWGPIKHLTVWGSIILLVVIIIYAIRCYLVKLDKKRWQRICKEAKKE